MALDEDMQRLWRTAKEKIPQLDFGVARIILDNAEIRTILAMVDNEYTPSEQTDKLIEEAYREGMCKGCDSLQKEVGANDFDKAIITLAAVKEHAKKAKAEIPLALEKGTYALGVPYHMKLAEKWLQSGEYETSKKYFDAATIFAQKAGVSLTEHAPLLERIGRAGMQGELEKARNALYREDQNVMPFWDECLERASDYARMAKQENDLPLQVRQLITKEFDQLLGKYIEYLTNGKGIDAKAHLDRLQYYASLAGKPLPEDIKNIQKSNDIPSLERIN